MTGSRAHAAQASGGHGTACTWFAIGRIVSGGRRASDVSDANVLARGGSNARCASTPTLPSLPYYCSPPVRRQTSPCIRPPPTTSTHNTQSADVSARTSPTAASPLARDHARHTECPFSHQMHCRQHSSPRPSLQSRVQMMQPHVVRGLAIGARHQESKPRPATCRPPHAGIAAWASPTAASRPAAISRGAMSA